MLNCQSERSAAELAAYRTSRQTRLVTLSDGTGFAPAAWTIRRPGLSDS